MTSINDVMFRMPLKIRIFNYLLIEDRSFTSTYRIFLFLVFTVRCYAERRNATVCSLSVRRLSVTFRYRDLIELRK